MEKTGTREVILAPHAGFCFGVKRALDIALGIKEDGNGEKTRPGKEPTATCGPLIHNSRVIGELAEKGVDMIDRLEESAPGMTVIVRSHGEPRSFYETAAQKGMRLVDTTCPYVLRIHDLVAEATKEGKYVVIVGSPTHQEVLATKGWGGDNVIIVENGEEMKTFLDGHDKASAPDVWEKGLFVVAQTTIKQATFTDVVTVIEASGIPATIENTICNATAERQKGCRETAEKVEAMIVVGDPASSNSKKLYEIASAHCENAYFIENIKDLSLKDFEKYNKIGVAAGASTPESAIKEVTATMSEKLEQELTMEDFMEDIEKSLRLPRPGELVVGKVLQVDDKNIIVNLGCKKDGVIPAHEVSLEEGKTLTDEFKVDDEIQAKVLKTDDGDGSILLSRRKLEVGEHWNEINQALEDKSVINVEVVRQVNGGVIAAYKEVSGFIPLSQLSDRYVEDSSEFVGQTLHVKVSRVDPRRGKAVFSHKAYLNEERQKAMQEIWEKIHVGDIVEGTVMRFTDYGAFVDIGGIDGLLHISEISWGKLKHPQEVLSVGEKISVKVLSMSAEKGKISLGLKQTIPEPWSVIDENYNVGDVVEGKVVQIKEYGCFVELEPGLDGLVHISEISHKRVGNINDELSIGEKVKTKILEIDRERRRISLSIKETMTAEEEEEMKAAKSAAKAEEVPAAAPAEEPAAEEAAEAPAAEEVAEAPAEEPVAEEAAEAPAAEESAAEEAVEAPVAEEASEEPAAEEAAEEPAAEEVAEAPAEEPAAEEATEAPVAEETAKEPAAEEGA